MMRVLVLLVLPVLAIPLHQPQQQAAPSRQARPPQRGFHFQDGSSTDVTYSSAPARMAPAVLPPSNVRFLTTFPLENLIRFLDDTGGIQQEEEWVEEPLGIAIDANNLVYVGSGADGSVQIFNLSGVLQGSLGAGAGEFSRPGDIAISPVDGSILVSDIGNLDLRRFDAVTRQQTAVIGASELTSPTGLAIANDGTIYVGDLYSGRVKQFDANGVFLRNWTFYGGYPGETARPIGLTLDSQGRLYVADAYLGHVTVLNTNARWVATLGNLGTGAGLMRNPLDVALHPVTEAVYVSDYLGRELDTFPAVP